MLGIDHLEGMELHSIIARTAGAALPLLLTGTFVQSFRIQSPDLKAGFAVRNLFRGFGCQGGNVAPTLEWSGVPRGARSLALTVYDPDAPTGSGWWHWFVADLPPTTRRLSGGRLPVGARAIRNDFGTSGYGGPCPPAGDPPHRYVFTVYALDLPKIGVPADATAARAGFAMRGHTLAKASMTVRYGR